MPYAAAEPVRQVGRVGVRCAVRPRSHNGGSLAGSGPLAPRRSRNHAPDGCAVAVPRAGQEGRITFLGLFPRTPSRAGLPLALGVMRLSGAHRCAFRQARAPRCGDRCHQRRIARSAILGWNETGGPCPSRRVSIWFGAVRKKACRVAARRARAPVAQGWGWDRTGKVEGRRRVRAAADGRVGRSARDSVSGEDACKGVATARSLGDPVRLRPVLERAAGGGRPYLSWERARGPAPPARFLLPRRGPPRVGRPWGERSRGGE